ncbi:MAG: hypothetical protein ACI4SR_04380 [Faecalibacillus sp.]
MKIDVKTLEKLIWILYHKYCHYQQIILKDVKIDIHNVIQLSLRFDYYRVETKIKAVGKIYVDRDIIVDLNGTIQYGIIHLDFYKALEEYTKDIDFIKIVDKKMIIKNEYLKDIQIHDDIELELL